MKKHLIKKYEYDKNPSDLRKEILELKRDNPTAEFFVRGYHYNHDSDMEDSDALQEIYGRLMCFASFGDSMVVHSNPWENSHEEYYASYTRRDAQLQIAGPKFSDPSKYGEREFLYIQQKEVVSYEMHYFPRNNKEAALLLTRLEDD